MYSKMLTSGSQDSVFFHMGNPISTHSRSSHAYAERISNVGPEDDDERGGGGTECEAYHNGFDNAWTKRIRSHAVWTVVGAQIPCILWALVLS
jgi:hypothetical protein